MKPGVPVIVAERGESPGVDVNTRLAGMPVCAIVNVFAASASVAAAVIVTIGEPSAPDAVAGAVIIGWELLPAGAPAPSQSNQSPVVPDTKPHGSAGSPTT